MQKIVPEKQNIELPKIQKQNTFLLFLKKSKNKIKIVIKFSPLFFEIEKEIVSQKIKKKNIKGALK